ncbi:MAG: diguanylate cyclase [Pseudomonadota bacterium]
MTKHFSDVDARALHDLIEGGAEDILIRLDPAGFIIHASSNAQQLGIDLSELLLMPHISDFAEPEFVGPLSNYALAALAGEAPEPWFEFPLTAQQDRDQPSNAHARRRWFAFGLRAIDEGEGARQSGMGVLRSVEHKHALPQELSAQAATDPITGLANRKSFCGALARALCKQSLGRQSLGLQAGSEACAQVAGSSHNQGRSCSRACDTMAIFAIDRMQAIFMQYGQGTTEEIRWGFSRFLETMTHESQVLAQLDEERFAVLMPGMTMRAAREWADDVLATFAGLTAESTGQSSELSASAGLARVELSIDWTLRQAELGLVMARAGGGMRAGVCGPARRMTNGAAVERAMSAAVERASRRQF